MLPNAHGVGYTFSSLRGHDIDPHMDREAVGSDRGSELGARAVPTWESNLSKLVFEGLPRVFEGFPNNRLSKGFQGLPKGFHRCSKDV